jgi:hypothetical protein
VESDWRQGFVGDDGRSYGIMQIKRTAALDDQGWPGTYPLSRESTAFNLDFWGRAFRSCYDGRDTFLRREGVGYGPGDVWGCVGLWNSGRWHDRTADAYIARVQRILATRGWPRG